MNPAAITHVLIGKVLFHMEEDEHCVSCFSHDLGGDLFLAVRLNPDTGAELPIKHIINLFMLTEDDLIFDSFNSMRLFCDEEIDGNEGSDRPQVLQ